jgi:glycosyltransferase involved in cell wall biosynthesis
MRVALVHYWLVTMRGGEKVLEALCRMYPDADIYTHVLDRSCLTPELARHNIQTTFINKLPLSRKLYQKYLPLMPLALERLPLLDYDLVISSESGPAKGVITRSDALHVCYCHTPMRYLWDHYYEYYARAGFLSRMGMNVCTPALRRWDVHSATMVDSIVANSSTVAQRVRKRWRRDAAVIHPPVNVDAFPTREKVGGEYYVCFGQLVHYKRFDLAIDACSRMGRRLVVVGDGEEMARLRARAGNTVYFAGRQPYERVLEYLRGAKALLFPGEEDFGIVPVEATASGVPVIAYGCGGVKETIVPGLNGCFFEQQSVPSLIASIEAFEREEYNFEPQAMHRYALRFSEERFRQEFVAHTDAAFARL